MERSILGETSPSETEYRILTVAARVRRYAMLRAAQRALSPIRSLPGRLPAEEALQQIRLRLGELTDEPPEDARLPEGADTEARRSAALVELDRMLEDVAQEFRAIAAQLSFAELRATLPRVRDSQPHEVIALLDLCLEDEEEPARFSSLIDYLATLLATELRGAERILGSDPVAVSPRLREVCERLTDYDPDEVRAHSEALDVLVQELHQAESIDPVLEKARALKTELGPLVFVPELFRKIVEYNIAAANRLEDDLEAERTLHELDLEATGTLSVVQPLTEPESEPGPVAESVTETAGEDEPEMGEHEIIGEIAQAMGRRVRGEGSGDGPGARIAEGLDLSCLSPWERQAVTHAEGDDAELVRDIVLVGSMCRKLEQIGEELDEAGLSPQRLEQEWLPRLDARIQSAITEKLQVSAHAEAKRLAQTRARFLSRILLARKQVKQRSAAERPLSDTYLQEWRTGKTPETRREESPKARQSTPRSVIKPLGTLARMRPIALAVTLGCLLVATALQFGVSKEARSAKLLPATLLAQFSAYLDSGYRDGAGLGPRFFGTVSDDWGSLAETDQREEAMRIADRLRWSGVGEVMLFDKRRRMVARWLGGKLVHPQAKE